jgi:hypothetical protein
MPNRFEQLLTNLKLSSGRLNSPAIQQEQQQQDMDPRNFRQIDRELARPGNNQVQNDALMNERQRLEKMQLQQITQASQQFAPRLAQSLDISQHTGMPVEGPADKLIKLLLMFKKQPMQVPGVNAQPVPNATPGGGPYNPMAGGMRG